MRNFRHSEKINRNMRSLPFYNRSKKKMRWWNSFAQPYRCIVKNERGGNWSHKHSIHSMATSQTKIHVLCVFSYQKLNFTGTVCFLSLQWIKIGSTRQLEMHFRFHPLSFIVKRKTKTVLELWNIMTFVLKLMLFPFFFFLKVFHSSFFNLEALTKSVHP